MNSDASYAEHCVKNTYYSIWRSKWNFFFWERINETFLPVMCVVQTALFLLRSIEQKKVDLTSSSLIRYQRPVKQQRAIRQQVVNLPSVLGPGCASLEGGWVDLDQSTRCEYPLWPGCFSILQMQSLRHTQTWRRRQQMAPPLQE
jgi:hypothetical protein